MNSSVNKTIKQDNNPLQCFYLDILPYEESPAYVIESLMCFINGISSIIATVANITIIISICKNRSLHSNSYFLLCCLAFPDAFVGLMVQPSFIVSKIGELTYNFSIHCEGRMLMETIGFICSGVSLCTLAAISLDMYLALYLHLRYKDLVTKRRLLAMIVLAWFAVSTVALSRLWFENTIIGIAVAIGIIFNLALIVFSYYKILKVVRRHTVQISSTEKISNARSNKRISEALKHKKFVYTMLYVAMIVVLSYSPLGCVIAVYIYKGNYRILQRAFDITTSLMLLNSSVNPVYYYFRMAELRRAVLKTLKKNRIEDLSVVNTTRRAVTNANLSNMHHNNNTNL